MKRLLLSSLIAGLSFSANADLVLNMDFNGNVTDQVTGTTAEVRGNASDVSELDFVTDRHGNANGALDFNDNWLFLNNENLAQSYDSYTISLWVDMNYYRNYRDYLFDSRLGNGNGGLAIFYDMDNPADGTLEAFRGSGLADASLQNNGWHQIAFTYNNSTASGGLFIDGVLVDDSISADSFNPFNSLIFGHYHRENGDYTYAGNMDDFRFYSDTTSAVDIENLYLQESSDGVTNVNTPFSVALFGLGLFFVAGRKRKRTNS